MNQTSTTSNLTKQICKKELVDNIFPFWMDVMADKEFGGFYGQMTGEGKLEKLADKSVIMHTRMLWSFSSAHIRTGNPKFLSMARKTYEYLVGNFWDAEFGGAYWLISYDGKVKESKKQIYAQAFALYAFIEYYKITDDKQALTISLDLFQLIEEHSFDQFGNGYLEAFSREWALLEDLRLSDKDANEVKTMNTHLHILEAYTSLYAVWRNDRLKGQLENLIRLMLHRFIDKDGHFRLFFDENWQLMSDKISYGHDIEGGWLLHEAAMVLGDKELLLLVEKVAVQMTDAALKGQDKDGGFMNEGTRLGIEDSDKHWWPQAEAMVGLVNTWKLTGDEYYLHKAQKTWEFVESKLIDKTNGEWHWMTNRAGQVIKSEDKAGPWKACYHNARAMMELMERLGLGVD